MRLSLWILALALPGGCREDDVKNGDSGGVDSGDGGGDSGGDAGDAGDGGDSGGDAGDGGDSGGGDGGDGGGDPMSMVGDWLSEGENLSPLFAGDPYNYVSITAHFEKDGAYTVQGQDGDGAVYDFSGTYTADATTTPGSIVLTQTVPAAWTLEGIWEVDGDTLTYEVVLTNPDYGYTPPTPESGFGTTSGPGLSAGVNVQIYVRK